jgi:hypothetical protein
LAKHLTKDDLKTVVRLIKDWEGKLTWAKLVDKYKEVSGHQTTRQTLQSFEEIKTAYDAIRFPTVKKSPKPASLAMAQKAIERRDKEIAILQKQLSRYEEQFARWLYNARKRKITIEMLNQELPNNPIDVTVEE